METRQIERAVDHYLERVIRMDTREGRELAAEWRTKLIIEAQHEMESREAQPA